MRRTLEQLERLVEREMDVLAGLPSPLPSPEFLARVEATVRAEAARASRPALRLLRLPRWAAVAAALLLAVGLSSLFRSWPGPAARPGEADELLAAWVEAVDHAHDRLTFLLDDGWVLGGAEDQDDGAIDGLLDSLDQSFEAFDTL